MNVLQVIQAPAADNCTCHYKRDRKYLLPVLRDLVSMFSGTHGWESQNSGTPADPCIFDIFPKLRRVLLNIYSFTKGSRSC